MSPLSFAAQRLGKRVRSAHGLGGQCVDLVEEWAALLGKRPIPGNAAQLFGNAPPGDWRLERNGPTNAPPSGAIVVWGPYPSLGVSEYGHTGIAIAADSARLLTLDQNWPAGSPVAFVLHTYGGVIGWLIPS